MAIEAKKLVDVERGLLDRSIFVNEEVYQQELEHIFGRSWLFLGHESLIPNPNDFYLTYMGEDPVILTRDAQGVLHAFLNMCMHRGNRIVRADDGNAKNFMCTYHGWTYSNDGKLASVPGLQEAYYGELDVDNLGLVEVAYLDSYAGFVFATWDPGAPSLEDWLGDMRWYMDILFNRREGGVELVGPDKWIIPTNWKSPADNFVGDMYHAFVSHRSAMIVRAQAASQGSPPQRTSPYADPGNQVNPGNGHGLFARVFDTPEDLWSGLGQQGPPLLTEYEHSLQPEMEQRLGHLRAYRVRTIHHTVFPNMSWLSSGTLRMWHPRGPEKLEIWAFVFMDSAASQDAKDLYRVASMQSFGVSGLFEQADMDNWRQCTDSGRSPIARRVPQNISMGVGHDGPHSIFSGTVAANVNTEVVQRSYYVRWEEMMRAKSWKDITIEPRTGNYEGTATFKG